MIDFNKIKEVYFLGIGGIGMSAIARYFNFKNIKISGYDKTATALTNNLTQEGITINYIDDIEFVKEFNADDTLVVLTPAIPKDHKQYNWFLNNRFNILKRSEILGIISKAFKTVGVAGTHGKTTTSALIAHILKQSKLNCTAFLGGISSNYNTNFLIDNITNNNIVVVEADEFDRSFLTLFPFYAVITSCDADHLDIYGEENEILKSFSDYGNRLINGGTLFIKHNLSIIKNIHVNYKTYGFNQDAYAFAKDILINKHQVSFTLCIGSNIYKNLALGIPGLHNIENAIAAAAVCINLGVSEAELRAGLESFKGVKRRFEYIIKEEDKIFIDDYAHHPEELKAIINSVKSMYPQMRLTVAFQPHLYTRTRDFAIGFAESLSLADEVFLLDIYPARELPITGVTSEIIYNKITVKKHLCTKVQLPEIIKNLNPELFCTLGAGDIDTLVEPIKNLLIENA